MAFVHEDREFEDLLRIVADPANLPTVIGAEGGERGPRGTGARRLQGRPAPPSSLALSISRAATRRRRARSSRSTRRSSAAASRSFR